MSQNPFLQFIDLVAIDQKIFALHQKTASLDTSIDTVNTKRLHIAAFDNEIQQKIMDLKKKIHTQELEMKVLDEKECAKKRQLDSLSDYSEYQAIKNEIEAVQRLQIAQEKTILNAWHELESMQALREKKLKENQEQMVDFDQELAQLIQEKESLSQEIADLLVKRNTQVIGIAQEWLDKYEVMSQKVTDPVVPIKYDSCGGCYQQLITQDCVRARRGALLQCKKCFRLLFLPEAVSQ